MEEIKKKWNTHQISCDWNRNRAFGNKVCDMNCENVFESVFSSEIDLAVSKERERIVKWVKDNEYCSKCCFPKKSCRKWGESASAIDTDDLLALINTK